MIIDYKLYFDKAATLSQTRASTNVLDFKSLPEPGKGSQLYVNIYSHGGFKATGTYVTTIKLQTGTTSPGATNLMDIWLGTEASLSVAGLIAKVPLPSKGLSEFVSLNYYWQTAPETASTISAFLTLE